MRAFVKRTENSSSGKKHAQTRPAVTYRPAAAAVLALAIALVAGGLLPVKASVDPDTLPGQGMQLPQGAVSASGLAQVTVEARRKSLENSVRAFVSKLTHSSRFSNESVPRWHDPLCFMVAGLPKGEGSYVLARLLQVARTAGAKVREQGCVRQDVNFYVVFTPDPARTLKYLNVQPALLFHSDASRSQMERFLSPVDSAAVRIWHNAVLTGSDGQRLAPDYAACLSASGMLINCVPGGGSRLTVQALQQFTEAVVVVDSGRLDGANLGQISDYIAMAGLADFALDATFGDAPTILRLFTEPAETRPKELTEWDRAFLSALYHTDQRSVTQRDTIATNVLHQIPN